jgi:hypothetical protein
MKKLLLIPVLFLFLISCGNSDDDNNTPPVVPQSFNFDGQTYNLLGTQGITEGRMTNVFDIDGTLYDRSTISVIGLQGFTNSGTVSFDLYYKHGMSVAGTYNIFTESDSETDFAEFIQPLDRGCMGWISMATSFTSGGGNVSANNPGGTVKVIANSPTNYTIQFNGNFKVYEDGFTFVRNAPAVVNVTGNVFIQQGN